MKPAAQSPRATSTARVPKRERTRREIMAAAIQVMSEQGATRAVIHEIAARANVTTGTVYNHFRGKAEIIEAVADWFSATMLNAADEARAALPTGAERIVDGCQRYLSIARESPRRALLVLELAAASPTMLKTIGGFVLADVRMGARQKEFTIFGEQAAVDLVLGYVMLAMRIIALERPAASYERSVVATILQGLGLPSQRAAALAGGKV
jgi:AcrR family transcriptional regulator